jgi:ABC-type phosphate/phosphonate transport system substrate-binding protein
VDRPVKPGDDVCRVVAELDVASLWVGMTARERIAALAMYDAPAAVSAANDALWAGLRDRLRATGVAGVPEGLDRSGGYADPWLDPRLLLAQTCGFPYVRHLRGRVRLVATPVYGFPGGEGAERRSVVVVAADAPFAGVEDLRGARAAINDPGSNSGANLLAALVAPLARDGRFFATVTVTGGHRESLAAVAAGRADVAAIDSVTFGLLARHAPAEVAGVRVLCETPGGPGLPLITRGEATDEEVLELREALADVLVDAELAAARETLGLVGVEMLGDADYAVLARYSDEAAARGYRELA